MVVVYVRVSTAEQSEARQIEALERFNIEKWFTEKVSGKDTKRPKLQAMLDFVREGDVVYVMDFSRLSRSARDLLSIVDLLNEKNVRLVSLKENLDTSTPTGKLMLTVIGAIAEFERQNTLERQREGIEIAKREGKYKGRKPLELENFGEIYKDWKAGKITVVAICELLKVTRATFYNKVREYENNNESENNKGVQGNGNN